MKKHVSLILCLLICLAVLAGCSCKHTWVEANCVAAKTCSACDATEGEPLGHTWAEADCVTAKTCSVCQATDGEPLGHTWVEADCVTAKTCSVCQATDGEPLGHMLGQWQETADTVAATVSRVQHCTVCNELTGSETVPLTTMIQDDLFLFTPNEFLERLTALANQHVDGFSYEFVPYNGLIAYVYSNEKQAILQFFRRDATLLATDATDVAEVWCVSLISVGEADADLRHCFYMACDPTLDKEAALTLDAILISAQLNAAFAGEGTGYYQDNGLLYETSFIPEELTGDVSMNMYNIYASDFR